MDRATVLALALAVVLAGCTLPIADPPGVERRSPSAASPTATPAAPGTTPTTEVPAPEPTETPTATGTDQSTSESGVVVRGGSLTVDEDLVFDRVVALTGREVAPPTVTVRDLPSGSPVRSSDVYRILGLADVETAGERTAGVTYYDGSVVLDPTDDPAEVERTLAHEYVHVVQFRTGMVEHPRGIDARDVTDVRMTWQTLVEGGAVYVADAYVERHGSGPAQSTVIGRLYEDPPTPASRLTLGWYHFGYRYVDARIDEPSNLEGAYAPFPNSTEQVLHNETPTAEPPLVVNAEIDTGGDWTVLRRADRKGELFVRVLLRTELDRNRSARAAAGWGNDRWWLLYDDETGDDAVAWILRWDSRADADEFERAVRAYVDRRRATADGRFRVERVAGDTVAVYAGEGSFVDDVATSTAGGEVTVTVEDEAAE